MTAKRFVRGSLLRLRNAHSSVNCSKKSRCSESSLLATTGLPVCFLVVLGKGQSNQSGEVVRLGSIGSSCVRVRCGQEIWLGSEQTRCLHGNCSSSNLAAYIGPETAARDALSVLLAVATAQFSESFICLAMLKLASLAEAVLRVNRHSCQSRSERTVPLHAGVKRRWLPLPRTEHLWR
jgi:hypothetical protein